MYLRKDLYHTLFESHLSYCISVWGGIPSSRTNSLWLSQKQCMRMLFGDKEAFLNKFRTAVRTRSYPNQLLGEEFYNREHTKPLFQEHKILTLPNLFTFFTYMELFKILKLRDPITMHSQFTLSQRKPTLLINDFPSENFVSTSTKLWNIITPKLKLIDFSTKISTVKNRLKKGLLILQNSNNPIIWTVDDFNVEKISTL